MKSTRVLFLLVFPLTFAMGACSSGGSGQPDNGGSPGSGGRPNSGGAPTSSGGAGSGGVGSGGTSGSGGANSGGANSGGSKGSGGATGSGGASAVGGANSGGTMGGGGSTSAGGGRSGGSSGSGGARSGGASGTGGVAGAGGAVGAGGVTGNGGTGTARTGGTTGTVATGGASATGGNAATGGATGSGGSTGTGVTVSPTCKIPSWPSPTGSTVTISGTKSVTDYDGGGALHEGNLNDCSIGDQDSNNPILEVADGGSVKNVIFGKKIGDGIHCLGSCTIENVWFQYICDDAITINKDGDSAGASSIKNSGFKGARDKTIQHNGGNSSLTISDVYVETAGKLYRSCGEGGGCTTSAKHTVTIANVVAIGVNQVAGVSENDQVTLSNICTFRTPIICNTYKVGSDTDSTKGVNGTGEGPSPNCSYRSSDTHALVNRVGGVTLTTDVLCTGSNSAKTGDTATACVAGFESCLKVCAPGMYGFKQLGCSGGKYTGPSTGGCALVTAEADSAAATNLAGTRAATASGNVTKNASCTTQWVLGKDSSKAENTCACVMKPGYYGQSEGYAQPVSWMVWDCQAQWW